MSKLITFVMYSLWTATIVVVLATTFTNFQYLDLNVIAGVLFMFALLNSYFMVVGNKKNSREGRYE